jgi:hypothetical protein
MACLDDQSLLRLGEFGSQTLTKVLTEPFHNGCKLSFFEGACGMKAEAAETVALQALGWLAGQDDLFGQFLGATGATATSVAEAAGRPEFLAAVLDFVLMDDAWVVAFCDAAGIGYGLPMQARAALPGGQMVHWT